MFSCWRSNYADYVPAIHNYELVRSDFFCNSAEIHDDDGTCCVSSSNYELEVINIAKEWLNFIGKAWYFAGSLYLSESMTVIRVHDEKELQNFFFRSNAICIRGMVCFFVVGFFFLMILQSIHSFVTQSRCRSVQFCGLHNLKKSG